LGRGRGRDGREGEDRKGEGRGSEGQGGEEKGGEGMGPHFWVKFTPLFHAAPTPGKFTAQSVPDPKKLPNPYRTVGPRFPILPQKYP